MRAFAMLATLSVAALPGCKHEPPEQALRNTIATMQAAAESGDTDALFGPIAQDFSGSEVMDRQAFRRYVTLMRLRNARVSVTLGPIDVKLLGDRATADFSAAISGGAGLLPENAQVYEVQTGWRMDGGKWALISARWQPKL